MATIHCSTSFFFRDEETGDFSFHMFELNRADFDSLPCDVKFPERELTTTDGQTFWSKSLSIGGADLYIYTNVPPQDGKGRAK